MQLSQHLPLSRHRFPLPSPATGSVGVARTSGSTVDMLIYSYIIILLNVYTVMTSASSVSPSSSFSPSPPALKPLTISTPSPSSSPPSSSSAAADPLPSSPVSLPSSSSSPSPPVPTSTLSQVTPASSPAAATTSAPVPDEQRLYTDLMGWYESSVRPVVNASSVINVKFKLTLNQIVDLDERKQVLTTNVFIDQWWTDENLKWNSSDYNGIKTLRVPASYVWLPDTFIFNNADDGSTGFMQGVYVLLNANGTVLWPVPVKLKSSCKVNIAFFPFDDQRCVLRFGSWIYTGQWLNYESSIEAIDLTYYIDNSEWELLSIQYEQSNRVYSGVTGSADPHPDLTYHLHMRRRTFYYIFNIIVPCVMLSVLTLLTFWLPTTSGEKISLGLSVFLAFSMFMLLIAEEVPATSESIPLVGIYLTTVMTMTSTSVVMAVLVINLYNRGEKAHRAPKWLKILVLDWLSRVICIRHDIDTMAQTIRLDEEEEKRYHCAQHHGNEHGPFTRSRYSLKEHRLIDDRSLPIHKRRRQRWRSSNPRPLGGGRRADEEEFVGGGELHRRFSQLERSSARRRRGRDESNAGDTISTHTAPASVSADPICGGHLDNNRGQAETDLSTSPWVIRRKDPSLDSTYIRSVTDTEDLSSATQGLTATVDTDDTTLDADQEYSQLLIASDSNNTGTAGTSSENPAVEKSSDDDDDHDENHVVDLGIRCVPITELSADHTVNVQQENEDDDDEVIWKKRDSYKLKTFRKEIKNNRVGSFYSNNPEPDVATTSLITPVVSVKAADLVAPSATSACVDVIQVDDDRYRVEDVAPAPPRTRRDRRRRKQETLATLVAQTCRREKALIARREMVVEWQIIATVIDRLLFWMFLLITIVAYLIILVCEPLSKPTRPDNGLPTKILNAGNM